MSWLPLFFWEVTYTTLPAMKRFAGEDALAWDQSPADAPASANHVQKRLQKRKGVEVAFDPKAHRDYLTGFKRRKDKRRKEAAKQLDEKARKQKQVERAEKKAKLRADLQLERYESHSEQEGADSAVACATVHVLQSPLGQTSTVTVAPFSLHSDEEPAGDSDASSDSEAPTKAQESLPASGRRKQHEEDLAQPQQPKLKQKSAWHKQKGKRQKGR